MKFSDKTSKGIFFLGVLFFANIFAWQTVYDLSQDKLEVVFFDVGQGDAVFIETSKNRQILIDGGPSSVILEKLAREMPFWDRTIDLIILTHPEQDHLTGLLDVLKRYKIKNILWTGIVRDTAEYKEWVRLLEKERAEIFLTPDVDGLTSGVEGVELKILHPFESRQGKHLKDSNPTSIVLRLAFGETSFLFTGDISKSIERQLLNQVKQLMDSDVLKVAHHGSKNSSAEEFIAAVSPEIAVIPAGKNNSYGHPHQETLDTLAKYGIKIFRTDLDGDIKIISNGKNYGIPDIQNQN